MTEKERFIKALTHQSFKGKVPTFELVFFLTMEKFGKVHPVHRGFGQWNQMSVKEKEAQLQDTANTYIMIAKEYGHSAIFVQPNVHDFNSVARLLEIINENTNGEYYVCMHGDPTLAIPDGGNMIDFAARLYEEPESVVAEQEKNLNYMLDFAEKIKARGNILDGFTLCSDYCFNVNPFYTPTMFSELIAPPLKKVLDGYRSMGYYSIKHTDGNIMPILDMMLECGPDGLHSLDPQGGVDLKYLKKYCGDKVCLCGNVNCGLLQTGTEEEAAADVRRSLNDGMPGYGYIFCTSNCVYTGLDLNRYELMMNIWKKEGVYR